ncbi:MAG: hypothetical protein NW205_12930 [Hyphomicrobiaceae bacterium]|nr:hypothetical protein [Hyphomicrobiaceae bacterium]
MLSVKSEHVMSGLDPAIQGRKPAMNPRIDEFAGPDDRKSMLGNYAEWIDLLEVIPHWVASRWTADELQLHRHCHELSVISMRAGEVARIFRERGRGVLRSNVKHRLHELNADVPGVTFYDTVIRFTRLAPVPAYAEDVREWVEKFFEELVRDSALWQSSKALAASAALGKSTE